MRPEIEATIRAIFTEPFDVKRFDETAHTYIDVNLTIPNECAAGQIRLYVITFIDLGDEIRIYTSSGDRHQLQLAELTIERLMTIIRPEASNLLAQKLTVTPPTPTVPVLSTSPLTQPST